LYTIVYTRQVAFVEGVRSASSGTPAGVLIASWIVTGGVVAALLNRRLMAGTPIGVLDPALVA
jgi:hypothetical protein